MPMMMPPVALPVAMPMSVPVPASVNQPNAANSLVAPIGNRSASTEYDENNARMSRPQQNGACYGAQNMNSSSSSAYGVDSWQQQNRFVRFLVSLVPSGIRFLLFFEVHLSCMHEAERRGG